MQFCDLLHEPRLVLGGNETSEDWNLGVEYQNYLKEVVTILESDPDFRKKLESANVSFLFLLISRKQFFVSTLSYQQFLVA